MEYILTILYGLVEGITEWLPISSTGHFILLEKFKVGAGEELDNDRVLLS